MQAMFIDVDGTLSSPCYKVNGKFQIGMSDVQWADYCIKHGEDTYEWCRPVMQVKEYAMKAKEKGTKLYVLTTSGTKIETAAKRRFLDRYYAGMFDDIYAVEHDDDKVRFILKKAAELGIEPSDCELVEDTYRILLQTNPLTSQRFSQADANGNQKFSTVYKEIKKTSDKYVRKQNLHISRMKYNRKEILLCV